MYFKRIFMVSCCLLVSTVVCAKQDNGNGVEPRVEALEELTLQQQSEIDKNSSDIQQNAADILELQKGGGGGGSGIGWELQDANGDSVGNVVSVISSQAAVVELSAGAETFLATALHQKFQYDGWTLYFAGASCTGQTYTEFRFTDQLQDTAFFIQEDDVDARVPYKVSGAPVDVEIGSYLYFFNGSCQPYGFTVFDAVPINSLGMDFNTEYTPPFTLVKP